LDGSVERLWPAKGRVDAYEVRAFDVIEQLVV